MRCSECLCSLSQLQYNEYCTVHPQYGFSHPHLIDMELLSSPGPLAMLRVSNWPTLPDAWLPLHVCLLCHSYCSHSARKRSNWRVTGPLVCLYLPVYSAQEKYPQSSSDLPPQKRLKAKCTTSCSSSSCSSSSIAAAAEEVIQGSRRVSILPT